MLCGHAVQHKVDSGAGAGRGDAETAGEFDTFDGSDVMAALQFSAVQFRADEDDMA